jgi:arylsulfatase A-like enzyme
MTQPNILVIIPDDLGMEQVPVFERALDPTTYPPMPNVCRLAQNGTRFDRAYSQPWCSPTRAEFVTGSWGFQTGIGQVTDTDNQPLLDSEVTLPAALKLATGNAYTCAEIGKHHLSGFQNKGGRYEHPIRMGYDYYSGLIANFDTGEDYYSWTETTAWRDKDRIVYERNLRTRYLGLEQIDRAADWIEKQTKPWYLHYTMNLPHAPQVRPPAELYDTAKYDLTNYDPQNTTEDYIHWKACVNAMDTCIGRLLARIPQQVLANTVIIFWSDNGTPSNVRDPGENANHFKTSVYEMGIRVPVIFSGWGVGGRGRNNSQLWKSIDLFRTVIEIAGGDIGLVPASPIHGRPSISMWKDAQGISQTGRTYVWVDYFTPNAPHINCTLGGQRAVIAQNYKVIRKSTGTGSWPNFAAGAAPNANFEYYFLSGDSRETLNLIGSSSPFYSGGSGLVTLTDANPSYPGALTLWTTLIGQYASITSTLA